MNTFLGKLVLVYLAGILSEETSHRSDEKGAGLQPGPVVIGKLKNQKFNIDVDSGIVIVRRENENSLTKIIFRTYYCADNFFYYNFFPIINAEEVVTLVKLEGSEWNL